MLDVILIVGGACLTMYSLMSFRSSIKHVSRRLAEVIPSGEPVGIAYYYTEQSILYGTVGVGLIALGFVLRRWYKK